MYRFINLDLIQIQKSSLKSPDESWGDSRIEIWIWPPSGCYSIPGPEWNFPGFPMRSELGGGVFLPLSEEELFDPMDRLCPRLETLCETDSCVRLTGDFNLPKIVWESWSCPRKNIETRISVSGHVWKARFPPAC